MTRPHQHRLTKGLGALLGASLAVLALWGWQVAGGSGSLAAGVVLEVNRTGELDVSPLGRFLSASRMKPGARPMRGSFTVRNHTGTTVLVRVRALPSSPDLDRLLELRLVAGRRKLFEGDLRDLRRWTRMGLTLAPGQARRIAVQTWLPAGVSGYKGRRSVVELDLRALEA